MNYLYSRDLTKKDCSCLGLADIPYGKISSLLFKKVCSRIGIIFSDSSGVNKTLTPSRESSFFPTNRTGSIILTRLNSLSRCSKLSNTSTSSSPTPTAWTLCFDNGDCDATLALIAARNVHTARPAQLSHSRCALRLFGIEYKDSVQTRKGPNSVAGGRVPGCLPAQVPNTA